jgi:hypothetical protein
MQDGSPDMRTVAAQVFPSNAGADLHNYRVVDKDIYQSATYYLVENDREGHHTIMGHAQHVRKDCGAATEENNVQVYPNPANDYLNILIHSVNINESARIELMDVMGRTVISSQTDLFSGSQRQQLDARHLPAGTYLLQVTLDGGDRFVQKIFKK